MVQAHVVHSPNTESWVLTVLTLTKLQLLGGNSDLFLPSLQAGADLEMGTSQMTEPKKHKLLLAV